MCPTLCDPMNRSTPGLPVHRQLPELTQTHVHQVGDAIQPSHPLSSASPPAPNPSQHQGLIQWVNSFSWDLVKWWLQMLSWSFDIMIFNMKTLKFSEKILCVVCCCVHSEMKNFLWSILSPTSWLCSHSMFLVSTCLTTTLIVASLYPRPSLPHLLTVSPQSTSTF